MHITVAQANHKSHAHTLLVHHHTQSQSIVIQKQHTHTHTMAELLQQDTIQENTVSSSSSSRRTEAAADSTSSGECSLIRQSRNPFTFPPPHNSYNDDDDNSTRIDAAGGDVDRDSSEPTVRPVCDVNAVQCSVGEMRESSQSQCHRGCIDAVRSRVPQICKHGRKPCTKCLVMLEVWEKCECTDGSTHIKNHR
jgi:hypothetical protein